jgi:hypothetical protein
MLSLILRVVAFLLFVLGALNQPIFHQGQLKEYGWGLAAWVLATLLAGYGPQTSWGHPPQ